MQINEIRKVKMKTFSIRNMRFNFIMKEEWAQKGEAEVIGWEKKWRIKKKIGDEWRTKAFKGIKEYRNRISKKIRSKKIAFKISG